MQLTLDQPGMIPATYPATFYRVSDWRTGRFIADYSTQAEAVKASYASTTGKRFDDSVATMHRTGR